MLDYVSQSSSSDQSDKDRERDNGLTRQREEVGADQVNLKNHSEGMEKVSSNNYQDWLNGRMRDKNGELIQVK